MRKYLIYSTLAILLIITVFIIYLSAYGVKTEKFNDLITDKIKIIDPKLSLNINEVFLKLDVKEKSIKINTENAKIYFENEFINFLKIDLNLNIIKFLKKENSIEKIKITTAKSKIKNITSFLNSYKFNIQRLIIYNQIEDGFIQANVDVNFYGNSQKKLKFNIIGKISEAKLNIFNKIIIKDINFDFNIKDEKYTIIRPTFNYEEINFFSKEILIEKFENNYKIKGDLANEEGLIDPNFFSKIFNINLDFLENKKILAKTKNEFKFKINQKKKIKDLDLISKINFKEIFINKKIQNLIYFQNGIINTSYKKNNLSIDINSGYSFLKNNYKNSEKDKININIVKKKNKDFKIEAYIKNENNLINSSELSNYIKKNNKIVKEQDIIFGSENKITLTISEKNKVKNLIVKSKLNIDKILINYKSSRLNKIFPNYKNIIKIKNILLNIDFSNEKTEIFSQGDYSFTNKYDKFNFEILKNKNDITFDVKTDIVANPLIFEEINYKKKKDIFSEIKLNGKLFENNKIKFENINLLENQNYFSLSNLHLSNDYKIIKLDKLKFNYLNNNKKLNQLNVLKKNNKFILKSENFDGKYIIKNLLKGDSRTNFLKRFVNINSEIILNFDQFFIDDNDYLKKINGNIFVKNNKIKYANIFAKLNSKHDFNLNIKTNSKDEKITNIFIDNPEPFVKHYKFIKGFKEGSLSYNSIEKNEISNSKLKIFDFKVKEVPVLAKILTLASLQGIADLLTGEGIRFNDFEMAYESSKNLTKIKEIYAIGPAISVLINGYIEKDKLISLRGTLVPATTINKVIAKIPLVGDLLVGKKTGEGVFGVSFKIKGPPKDLKTTVNPVKTLTPRFITRTLEKLKKN